MMQASPKDDEKEETTDYTDFFCFFSCFSWINFMVNHSLFPFVYLQPKAKIQ
jgi:hypothetical protein